VQDIALLQQQFSEKSMQLTSAELVYSEKTEETSTLKAQLKRVKAESCSIVQQSSKQQKEIKALN
jgi:hypothetical protein